MLASFLHSGVRAVVTAVVFVGLVSCSKHKNDQDRWIEVDTGNVQYMWDINQLGSVSLDDSRFEMEIEGDDLGVDGEISFQIEDSYSLAKQAHPITFSGVASPYAGDEDFISNDRFHATFVSDEHPDDEVVVDGVRTTDGRYQAIVKFRMFDGNQLIDERPIGRVVLSSY